VLATEGRYVDGPLITVVKKDFIWDDFDAQETFSWLHLFAFIWPVMAIPVEHWWHEKPTLLQLLQLFEPIAATFYSCAVIAASCLFRSALIGTYLSCTALGIFSLCAIISSASIFQYLYTEVQTFGN